MNWIGAILIAIGSFILIIYRDIQLDLYADKSQFARQREESKYFVGLLSWLLPSYRFSLF